MAHDSPEIRSVDKIDTGNSKKTTYLDGSSALNYDKPCWEDMGGGILFR